MAEKKYIAGIHNYCDRWCDRCAFTARCRVYENEQSNPDDLSVDPDSPEFWEGIRNNFQDTLEMLQGLMERLEEQSEIFKDENNLNSEEPEELDTPFTTPERPEWPDIYGDAVHEFFKNNEVYFSDQETQFDNRIRMGLPVDVEQLGFLHEALQAIRWFQHFISAKIHRAISDLHFDKQSAANHQGDGNGSAKVAMIALQQSMDAWKYVESFFPDKRTEVQEIIRILADTKMHLIMVYPNWEQFHRPGFDDEPETVVRLDYNPN